MSGTRKLTAILASDGLRPPLQAGCSRRGTLARLRTLSLSQAEQEALDALLKKLIAGL